MQHWAEEYLPLFASLVQQYELKKMLQRPRFMGRKWLLAHEINRTGTKAMLM